MTNISRHDKGALVAGVSVGGRFASGSRTEATVDNLAGAANPACTVTVPPRKVELQNNATYAQSIEWPAGTGKPTDAWFGLDDSGRFYSAHSFTPPDGEEYDVIVTDMDEGQDFSGSLVWDSPNGAEIWDDCGAEIREHLGNIHSVLSINAHRVGHAACEEDPELERQVLAASIGRRAHEHLSATTEPERAVARAQRNIVGWGDGHAVEEDIRDVMTDLAHYADSQGLDIRDLFNHAMAMRLEERGNSHV